MTYDSQKRKAAKLVRSGVPTAIAARATRLTWGTVKAYCRRNKAAQPSGSDLIYVYGVTCPLSDQIVYVGASHHPWRRLIQHWYSPASELMREWVASLKANDLRPGLVILCKKFTADPMKLEKRWIKKVGRQYPLMNREDQERELCKNS